VFACENFAKRLFLKENRILVNRVATISRARARLRAERFIRSISFARKHGEGASSAEALRRAARREKDGRAAARIKAARLAGMERIRCGG
jgi:hypothetical protein